LQLKQIDAVNEMGASAGVGTEETFCSKSKLMMAKRGSPALVSQVRKSVSVKAN
jgi:hypothetical protein